MSNNNDISLDDGLNIDFLDGMNPNETDTLDEAYQHEESHYRRSSYNNDDEGHGGSGSNDGSRGGRRNSRGRTSSPGERSRDFERPSGSRDNKYDTGRHERGGGRGGRSRSRSPGAGRGDSSSLRDRRVYIGNLSYEVKWTNLKDFVRQSR